MDSKIFSKPGKDARHRVEEKCSQELLDFADAVLNLKVEELAQIAEKEGLSPQEYIDNVRKRVNKRVLGEFSEELKETHTSTAVKNSFAQR